MRCLRIAVLVGLWLVCGCGREGAEVSRSFQVEGGSLAADAEPEGLPEPAFEAAAPAERPIAEAAPRQRQAPRAAVEVPVQVAEPEDPYPETPADLDTLLRIPVVSGPPPPQNPLEVRPGGSAAKLPQAPDPDAPWKGKVRVGGRSEKIGPAGPRQGTWSETDAGIRMPVDKRVTLEGGVRMEKRDEPGLEEPERKSAPRVGVEVKF